MYLGPSWSRRAEKIYKKRLEWSVKNETVCWRGKADIWPGLLYIYIYIYIYILSILYIYIYILSILYI